MRDRLTKLLSEPRIGEHKNIPLSCILNDASIEAIADHLLANGVIVSPISLDRLCWVIPTVQNSLKEITDMRCIGYSIGCSGMNANLLDWKNKLFQPSFSDFGKTVFLTREEAEKALAEREGKDDVE